MIIFSALQRSIKPRRRDFQHVGMRDRILYVERVAKRYMYPFAVTDVDAARLIDEDANNRTGTLADAFHVHQFQIKSSDDARCRLTN